MPSKEFKFKIIYIFIRHTGSTKQQKTKAQNNNQSGQTVKQSKIKIKSKQTDTYR